MDSVKTNSYVLGHILRTCPGAAACIQSVKNGSWPGSQQPVADGAPGLHRFLLPSRPPALDLAVPGTAWVTDETENSLDVEWENPDRGGLLQARYGPLTGQEVAEVTVPKSGDPKSRYDITGKSQHWGGEMLGVDAEVGTVWAGDQ